MEWRTARRRLRCGYCGRLLEEGAAYAVVTRAQLVRCPACVPTVRSKALEAEAELELETPAGEAES